jgi:integrase
MAGGFSKLDRLAIRRLPAGKKITERGITAEKLMNGDVRYSVNVMVDGERIHRILGRQSEGVTRTQAEEFVARARTEARENRLALPKGRKLHLTFNSAAELYLKKLKEIGGRDYINNEQHIRLHLRPYFGTMRLDKISIFTVQKFRAECRAQGLSDATNNRILATFRRMGRRLHSWHMLPHAFPVVKLEPERNQRTYVISEEEEEKLLEAALQDSQPYLWLFIRIGLATGLRHGEILSARFDNFDPMRRRLKVLVKGGRWRQQPLTSGCCDLLKKEREMAADQQGWIFPSKSTTSGHIEQMSAAFIRCVKRAGLNPRTITPHVMRHTAITRLSLSGADIKTIQEFSGHESLQMVLRYAHAQDRAVDLALDRMEARLTNEHSANTKTQKS